MVMFITVWMVLFVAVELDAASVAGRRPADVEGCLPSRLSRRAAPPPDGRVSRRQHQAQLRALLGRRAAAQARPGGWPAGLGQVGGLLGQVGGLLRLGQVGGLLG